VRGKTTRWIGVIAIACVGAIIFALRILDGDIAKSTSMAPETPPAPIAAATMAKEPITIQAISSIAAAKIDENPEPTTVPPGAAPQLVEPAASVPAEMTQKFQMLEDRLTGLTRGIEQIKSDQARRSEHQGKLEEMQEKLVLRVQELASALKAVEEKAAQDRLTAAEQLRASQEQLAGISAQLKASQEQIDRQKNGTQRRIARLAPPQPKPSNAPAAGKPAPRPLAPQAGASPAQGSRQLQPRAPANSPR
jgi:hypothetical protein